RAAAPPSAPAPVPVAAVTAAVRTGVQGGPVAPPDVNRLAERWDALVAAMKGAGRGVAATALEHAVPVAVTAKGEVTIALDEANPIYEQALEAVKGELATTLQGWFPGVQRVSVRAAGGSAAPPVRLTDEMVRRERLTAMRRRDPVLGAAIDALDLDLAD
ncbi:MAG: polymerase subunit gamma and tau, partial [Gemmatimonadetes bacterium]|nr:polymerase subunit gamma and tau [Gemmatimonadota bacterium]